MKWQDPVMVALADYLREEERWERYCMDAEGKGEEVTAEGYDDWLEAGYEDEMDRRYQAMRDGE